MTDPRKAAGALGWAVTEMLNRYKLFADSSVRDIKGYNEMAAQQSLELLPENRHYHRRIGGPDDGRPQ